MMEDPQYDVLILGSGISGIAAAKSLTNIAGAKLKIAVLDGGQKDRHYSELIPDQSFSEIKKNCAHQSRFFLGDQLEGVPRNSQKVGAQLTPPRQFIQRKTAEKLPFQSSNFEPLQSLAIGGLGAGWGAACFTWTDEELLKAGLDPQKINPWYQKTADWMGLSGDIQSDVAAQGYSKVSSLQPASELDSNAEALLKTYKSSSFKENSFYLGASCLALLTKDQGNRQACKYQDMDFWADHGNSVFRPRYALEQMSNQDQIEHLDGYLAESYREDLQGVTVDAENLANGKKIKFRAKKIIVCLGALNTARFVLKSQSRFDEKVPLLSNPYFYIPCINWKTLGKKGKDKRHSLSQLFALMKSDESKPLDVSIQFYSYRSLLLFKLIKEMPLPSFIGKLLARTIVESLTIASVHLEDTPQDTAWLQLKQDGILEAHYKPTNARAKLEKRTIMKVLGQLLRLKLFPLGVVSTGPAGSIHYAGTLPFGTWTEKNGRLKDAQHVWIGDSSPWKALSAKGLSLTLAASAGLTARELASELKS